MAACYRHPDRETNVACSNCGRPICPDCMTSTPVGMRCPECARQKTRVVRSPAGALSGASPVTFGLMGLCVAAFVAQVAGGMGMANGSPAGSVTLDYGLLGFGLNGLGQPIGVAEGEYYRIVTGGFLHSGLIHLAINMLALYFLGRLLEPAVGGWRFAGIFFVSLLGGSLGALILSPDDLTVGASGAVFGLMAAGFFEARDRGLHDIASQIGFYVVLNLVFTFSVPNISVGGHLGGLVAGGVLTLVLSQARRAKGRQAQPAEIAVVAGLGIALAVGCVAAGNAAAPL
ncbi:MAG: rhomboid family intramembrane serine protease [Actinomycetota bacterium]|nr:rhomboid family intramembrane serine protease [Actinomycetota bacterium]